MEKLLLIDGNSLLFRAYYATSYGNVMKTREGIPTNAIFAFANMMTKAIDMLKPKYCAVAFDKGKGTFRHEVYADYKAGRKAAPDELVYQFKLARDLLSAYNIPFYELDNIEADDIVGSLSIAYPDVDVDILSSDKDLMQLVSDKCTYLMIKKGLSDIVEVTPANIIEIMGVKANQVTDLKGLMGDTADNIKGVKGVGEKTAIKLIDQYQTIENIYEHIDEIKGKLKESLINDKDNAILSKELTTIKMDVALDVKLDDLLFTPNYKSLYEFYVQYEMKSLANRLNINEDKVTDEKVYETVTVIKNTLLKNGVAIYFDSDDFDYRFSKINGIAISDGHLSEYIAIDDALKDVNLLAFLNSNPEVIVYDIKHLLHLFDYNNLDVKLNYFDVFVAGFLYNPAMLKFDDLCNYLSINKQYNLEMVYGTSSKPKLVDSNMQIAHAIEAASNLYNMTSKLKEVIEAFNMHSLCYEVEMPLASILYDMEKQGIHCDGKVLDDISIEIQGLLNNLTRRIYSDATQEFNINSPKQLATILFDVLNLPTNKKRSTSIDVLEKLQGMHPIIDDILEYRKYAKIYGTYVLGLKKYIENDGKIRTIYNQCGALTGRMSSTDPNLQNISVKDEAGKQIRKAFIASNNCQLYASDYSQVELRILADLSNETSLIEAFKNGLDIHTKTASDIFQIPQEMVDDSLRRKAKAVNFGIVYGITDFGLAKQINSSVADAKKFIDNYFTAYPNIKKYMDEMVKECEHSGYVKTIMHRRRYISEIHDKNFMVREYGKRMAMNSPIQGSAADLIKVAMVNVYKAINDNNLKSKMILQVHDELIFDVEDDELSQLEAIVKREMENAMTLKVPLDVSGAFGKSWYDAK